METILPQPLIGQTQTDSYGAAGKEEGFYTVDSEEAHGRVSLTISTSCLITPVSVCALLDPLIKLQTLIK